MNDANQVARDAKGLAGVRVLSLESRRAVEMAKLIENYGGTAVVAPSMREIPIESNIAAIDFGRKLADGGFDAVILLTGVGTRALAKIVETIYPLEKFMEELKRVTVIVRGPKPLAVLREWGVPAAISVPEPNTWRDLLAAVDASGISLRGKRVALQEYGESNLELIAGLHERGAIVTQVPVYKWELPEDIAPLRRAVEEIAACSIGLALFTTSVQIAHLLQVAREMGSESLLREGLRKIVVGSIGPVTSEELREQGVHVDFEPGHPKMGFLVNEAARFMASRQPRF